VLVGGRSETIRGLRGDERDERFRQIDVHATAIAGLAVITAIIVAFIVEVARGHSGSPYSWLGSPGSPSSPQWSSFGSAGERANLAKPLLRWRVQTRMAASA
jgi:hypothetical protein